MHKGVLRVRNGRKPAKVANSVILVFVLIVILFPVYFLVMTSFQKARDVISYPPRFIFRPTLTNYAEILRLGLVEGTKNSLIVSILTLAFTFILGSPFSFVLSREDFRSKENFRFWLLTLRIMPPIVVIVPFIYLWSRVRLLDTYYALVVTYLTFSLPLYVWLTVESFRSVPQEVEEAAALDGCTLFQVFTKISVPIALPGLLSALVFTFVFIWNEFFFAFALTSRLQTLPLVVASHGQAVYTAPWGTLSALTSLLSVPPVILVVFLSKLLAKYFIIGG